MRIVVKYPSCGRMTRAAETLALYINGQSGKHHVRYVVVEDADDPAPFTPPPWITPHVALHPNKIAACNAFTPDPSEWDIMVMASDDMIPVADRWDEVIADAMAAHFPNLDGCLWFHDGFQDRLCTYPIMGANWFRKVGHIYHPDYLSEWADNEAHELPLSLRRLAKIGQCVLRHDHPAWKMCEVDETYAKGSRDAVGDKATYLRRRDEMFDWPEVTLSILIPSLEWREGWRAELLAELNRQINADQATAKRVEIVLKLTQPGIPTGKVRNELLDRSVGRYVVFVDDDDMVAPDYVRTMLEAIDATPGADCVELSGWMTVDAGASWLFHHSIDNPAFENRKDGSYLRTPNHCNPVRREIAVGCRFPEWHIGEDKEYMERIRPSLKVEAKTGKPLLYYRYRRGK